MTVQVTSRDRIFLASFGVFDHKFHSEVLASHDQTWIVQDYDKIWSRVSDIVRNNDN